MNTSFQGIFTPLVTPLCSDESPDLSSLRRLVDYQIANGVHGIWAMGTSAEFASFNAEERFSANNAVVETVAGRVPVIVNVSDASTRMAVRHAHRVAALDIDAIAATPPYYYPHTQDELLTHYRALRAEVNKPLFLYNIPQTVRVRLELSTVKTLIEEGVVQGIKDSQNDLEWVRQLALFVARKCPDFAVFAGTRHLIDAAVLAGAVGAIPSAANAFPDLCVQTYSAAVSGDYQTAATFAAKIVDLESITGSLPLGSRNAAVLGLLKLVLYRRGIIEHPLLTSPLRCMDSEEQRMAYDNVERLISAGVAN
ncbi:MAG: dihydrodipicolinate synthase family protein [Chloroflexota bacterium]